MKPQRHSSHRDLASYPDDGIVPRKLVQPGERSYGWHPCAGGLDYLAPSFASGPDPDGWKNFITARIIEGCHISAHVSGRVFLAVSFGCKWVNGERTWNPVWAQCATLEQAMDFCESEMVKDGVLPKLGKAPVCAGSRSAQDEPK